MAALFRMSTRVEPFEASLFGRRPRPRLGFPPARGRRAARLDEATGPLTFSNVVEFERVFRSFRLHGSAARRYRTGVRAYRQTIIASVRPIMTTTVVHAMML